MNSKSDSLIFIPDITGFTRFVNETEIKHSQHIISELLEILVKSNTLEMKVSEIEGDAILFYRENHIPDEAAIFEQAKQMFIAFHSHLKEYEARRICRCGACTTVNDLSLKFIVHQGEIGFTTVLNRSKPFGAEVVLSHRLLKNQVEAREYILFSEKYASRFISEHRETWTITQGNCEYPQIGRVNYYYTVLTDLKEEIPTPQKPVLPPKVNRPLVRKITINRPVDEVYQLIMSLEVRLLWNKDVEKLEYDENRVNRVGTRHTCLFPVGQAEFQTVTNMFEEGTLVYGEEVMDTPFIRQLFVYYILKPVQDHTDLRVELHLFPKPFIGWIFGAVVKFKFGKQLGIVLHQLKKISESQ